METDNQIIFLALVMRKCIIETGHSSISAADAKNMGVKVKTLSSDQIKLLFRINELIKKYSNGWIMKDLKKKLKLLSKKLPTENIQTMYVHCMMNYKLFWMNKTNNNKKKFGILVIGLSFFLVSGATQSPSSITQNTTTDMEQLAGRSAVSALAENPLFDSVSAKSLGVHAINYQRVAL